MGFPKHLRRTGFGGGLFMNIQLCLEAILFSAGRALSFKELARILECDEETINQEAQSLQSEYEKGARGVRLILSSKTAELAVSPEFYDQVRRFVTVEKSEITRAQIDTLAILAYRGPMSQGELEQIRGVNCSIILKNLSIDGLIEKITDQREPQYAVSTAFLKGLGISSLADLPEYNSFQGESLLDNEQNVLQG